ncbi:hypothetical protein [Mumia zhuanghuii]|uniref:hypothetical protein n=1 Tax=Mumia zhuanghuii TaxID=2585211 RepID=UPI00129C95E2|nr:hypothetical protein [Mumia zhuanghuii]
MKEWLAVYLTIALVMERLGRVRELGAQSGNEWLLERPRRGRMHRHRPKLGDALLP